VVEGHCHQDSSDPAPTTEDFPQSSRATKKVHNHIQNIVSNHIGLEAPAPELSVLEVAVRQWWWRCPLVAYCRLSWREALQTLGLASGRNLVTQPADCFLRYKKSSPRLSFVAQRFDCFGRRDAFSSSNRDGLCATAAHAGSARVRRSSPCLGLAATSGAGWRLYSFAGIQASNSNVDGDGCGDLD